MSEPNSHIRYYGPLALIDGNCTLYLNYLREAADKPMPVGPDRMERRREKFDFADFVRSVGVRSPKAVALVANGTVQHASGASEPLAAFLASAPHGHYFCKPNMGSNGIGAFRLTIAAEGLLIDDEPTSLEDVAARLALEDYVVQEWLAPLQHPDISRFRAGVINTMRLVTFDTDKGAEAVSASLRLAISLKSVDSWTYGGVVAAIDIERGVLKPFGILKKGHEIVETHPGSGLVFRDYAIPHFRQAVAEACRMHHMVAGPRSLGWDICFLEDGPCFLESNRPWDILMSAQFNPDLVPRLLAFYLPPACDVAARVQLTGQFANRFRLCWGLSRTLGRAMASGRVEHVSRDLAELTIGGTQEAVQAALQRFERKSAQFGVSGVKAEPAQQKPAPGFDTSGVFAGLQITESAHPD